MANLVVRGLSKWIQALNPYQPERMERDGVKPIELEESDFKRRTARVVIVFFLVFGTWAALAPLDAGVVVPGTVVVQGNRKAVQHPSGGVVEKLSVREGAQVSEGDVLVVLNPLNVDAALSAAELEHINAVTTLSRALSERTHRRAIEWDPKVKRYAGDERLAGAMRLQTEVFKSRTTELSGQQQILNEQLAGLEEQVKGLRSALNERQQQLKLVSEEARDTAALAKEGFVPRNQAFAAERSRSDLLANIATAQSELARVQASIAATRLQLVQLLSTYHKDLDTLISDVQKVEQGLQSKVDALRFERKLTEIRAPSSGTVVGLRVHTVGGVVTGGQVLMEIVPQGGRLIVDAQVPALHIDKVKVGMEADLRFTSFNLTTTPVIPGKVTLVGADKLTPTSQTPSEAAAAAQGGDFYLAQLEITPEGVKKLAELKVQPGMGVEVVVKSGERSFISYLVKPIADRFALAFRGD
jgi:protease secretion system membrane fusion protein